MFEDGLRLNQNVAGMKWEWWDAQPSSRTLESGIALGGELMREYVIAGLAEEDRMVYEAEILEAPCRDAEQRFYPVTVIVKLPPAGIHRGCGTALPVLD